MHIKAKTKEPVSKSTLITLLGDGATVQINHSQSIKLSANYQSAEATYGVVFTVQNTQKAIEAAITAAEELIEAPLASKTMQQRELLQKMGR